MSDDNDSPNYLKWLLVGGGVIGAMIFLAMIKTWLILGGVGVLAFLGYKAYSKAKALGQGEDSMTDRALEAGERAEKKIRELEKKL